MSMGVRMPNAINETEAAILAVEKHGTKAAAARALGIPVSTLKDRIARAGHESSPEAESPSDLPSSPAMRGDIDRRSGKGWLELTDYDMPSESEVLERHKLDPDVWQITRLIPNQWQGFIKTGARGEEAAEKVTLYSLRVHVERRIPEEITDAIERIASRVPALPKPTKRRTKRKERADDQLCVFGLYDAHIGAMAWEGDCDENNDTSAAVDRCIRAIDRLLDAISHHPVRKIIAPFGNDLMHYDNERGETTSGNVTTDYDTRYAKTFEACYYVTEYMFDRLLEVCDDVEGVVVCGNHARNSEYHIAKMMEMRYRNDTRVGIDSSPKLRKYRMWGSVLLGFAHFDRMNLRDCYRIMAEEAREHWSESTCREFHGGHYHNRKTIDQINTATEGQVTIRQHPSVTPRDHHSYRHAYDAVRCADVHRYNRFGYLGTDTTYAETA